MGDTSTQRPSTDATLTGWQERRLLLKDFREEVARRFNLSIGFSLFWTWVWLVFQTTTLSPTFFRETLGSMPSWVVPLSAYALTFSFLGFLLRAKKLVPHGRVYRASIPLTMSLGIAVCGILRFFPLESLGLNMGIIVVAAVVLGSATACLHVEWGRVLGQLGPRKTIIHGIIGTVLAAFILALITLLPLHLLWVCATAIPPASMLLLNAEARKHLRLHLHGIGTKAHVPWRFLFTSFLQGLSFGIAQAILLLGDHGSPTVYITATSFAVAAFALLACAFLFKMDFSQLIYHIGFVIVSFGFLLFGLIGADNPLALFTHGTGYRFIDIMMWALCTYLVKQRGLSANWVFAWTTCALLLGQVAGALLGSMVFFSDFSVDSTVGLSFVMVFVLLVSALLLSTRKNLQTGWGMVQPGENEAAADGFEVGCKLASRQYGLTAREEEVFALLARGDSRKAMCDTLFLSMETVKTHTRNIYKKLDIHSQQEVFYIVEEMQRQAGFDDEPAQHDMRL